MVAQHQHGAPFGQSSSAIERHQASTCATTSRPLELPPVRRRRQSRRTSSRTLSTRRALWLKTASDRLIRVASRRSAAERSPSRAAVDLSSKAQLPPPPAGIPSAEAELGTGLQLQVGLRGAGRARSETRSPALLLRIAARFVSDAEAPRRVSSASAENPIRPPPAGIRSGLTRRA